LRVIDQQVDGLPTIHLVFFKLALRFAGLPSCLNQFLVKLYKEQNLPLHVRIQVVVLDQLEDIWSSQSKEVLQCLAWLTVADVELRKALHQDVGLWLGKDSDDERLHVVNIAWPLFDRPQKRLRSSLVSI
jgi:hypothetical protein